VTWLAAPALPLDEAGKYVAAAYVVFLALILIYVAIMASKLVRIARDLDEVAELVERRDRARSCDPDAAGESTEEVVPR
jgi:predicted S18 family serine protease